MLRHREDMTSEQQEEVLRISLSPSDNSYSGSYYPSDKKDLEKSQILHHIFTT